MQWVADAPEKREALGCEAGRGPERRLRAGSARS